MFLLLLRQTIKRKELVDIASAHGLTQCDDAYDIVHKLGDSDFNLFIALDTDLPKPLYDLVAQYPTGQVQLNDPDTLAPIGFRGRYGFGDVIDYDEYSKYGIRYTEEVTVVGDVDIWKGCSVPLYTSIMRITGSDGSVRYWGLSSTFKPKDAKEAFQLYELRTQIEERHRQVKKFWHINNFSSPDESLIEAHVMFTLLTYSLIQLYLNKKHLNALANKTILSLKTEEQMGINSVIVYSGNYFAVFDLGDYTETIADLKDDARLRLQKWIKVFKKRDKFRGG